MVSEQDYDEDHERHLEKEAYLAGRWVIDGRRLRYEAGADIGLAVLTILKEYVADCEGPYFIAVHPELDQVKVLVERGEQIDRGEVDIVPGDLPAWGVWLRSVATLLPTLWD